MDGVCQQGVKKGLTADVEGERDLTRLIERMQPRLEPGDLVFATLPEATALPAGLTPIGLFREPEGLTLIVKREAAEAAGLVTTFPCRLIRLEVHSALDAVGLLAAVTARLAERGIAANVVSAYHHDHILVPSERAGEALAPLESLAEGGA